MDDVTFEAVYRRDHEMLRRALNLSLGDTPLANEAVDEAFTRAYASWPRVSQLNDPTAWLYRVASNWATSWLRKRRMRPVRPTEELETTRYDVVEDPAVLAAIEALPLPHRTVIVLRFYLDWDIARIATALDVPPGTVKSRLHRALTRLHDVQEVHR